MNYHLYLDGSYSEKFNDMGAGAVLVNARGAVVAEVSTSIEGGLSSNSGYELFALVKGLQLLDDVEYTRCVVYSDHQNLVHDLLHRREGLSSLSLVKKNPKLYERFADLLGTHEHKLIFRWQSDKSSEGIKRAHTLARRHIRKVKDHCFDIELNGGFVPFIPFKNQIEYIYDHCN